MRPLHRCTYHGSSCYSPVVLLRLRRQLVWLQPILSRLLLLITAASSHTAAAPTPGPSECYRGCYCRCCYTGPIRALRTACISKAVRPATVCYLRVVIPSAPLNSDSLWQDAQILASQTMQVPVFVEVVLLLV